MKKLKKYKIALIVIILLSILLFIPLSCFYKFAKAVQEEAHSRFFVAKSYIYNVSFEGMIIKKDFHKINEKKQDTYSVDILIKTIYPLPSVSQKHTLYFYYHFIEDSLLNLRITKKIYENIIINDIIKKDSNDYYIQVNGELFQLLNENEKKWFPDE